VGEPYHHGEVIGPRDGQQSEDVKKLGRWHRSPESPEKRSETCADGLSIPSTRWFHHRQARKGRQCVAPAVRPGKIEPHNHERRRCGTFGVPVLRTSDSGSGNPPPSRAGLFTAGPSALLTALRCDRQTSKLHGLWVDAIIRRLPGTDRSLRCQKSGRAGTPYPPDPK
jgi:hypothetical protein